jgi:hypothetical protein
MPLMRSRPRTALSGADIFTISLLGQEPKREMGLDLRS